MRGSIDKKLIKVLGRHMLGGLFLLFSFSTAFAGNGESIMPRHTFEIDAGVTHLDYKEETGPKIEIDGSMFEMAGSYTYHNKVMLHAGLEYAFGDLDYDGVFRVIVTDASSSETIDSPGRTETEDWIVECRGLIGYDLALKGDHVVTPFLGIGYRYWNDYIKGTGGYEREIQYWYSPIGVKTHSPLSENWKWGTSLEYDLFWEGTSGIDAQQFPDLHQDSGYGVRFSLQFNRQFADNYALSIEPYMTYWNIDKSDTETYSVRFPSSTQVLSVHEPENTSLSYGLRIGFEF
jgi:hypothetical protein